MGINIGIVASAIVAEIGLLPRLRSVETKSFNVAPLAFVPP